MARRQGLVAASCEHLQFTFELRKMWGFLNSLAIVNNPRWMLFREISAVSYSYKLNKMYTIFLEI